MSKEAQDPVLILELPEGMVIHKAEEGHRYASTKVYNHSVGLSCSFRQWRANHSHCQYNHGYALRVEVKFISDELDERNWVQDFGGLKDLKDWLEKTFDHKTLVARDDPQISSYREDHIAGKIQLVLVPSTGIEAFARLIFEWCVYRYQQGHIQVALVKVSEHDGNSAEYGVI